jgi:outer membrane protein TolC
LSLSRQAMQGHNMTTFHNPFFRHSGLDLACPGPDPGESRNYLKILDSGLRRNDKISCFMSLRKGLNILLRLWLLMTIISLTVLSGCATDFNRMRAKHTEEFQETLTQKSKDLIMAGEPLDLNSCIKIALENNLDIRIADIKGKLAGIDRNIAFSNFLPYIDVQVIRVNNNEQQLQKAMGNYLAMADQNITQSVISAQLAVLNPQTFLLYSAYKKGEDIQFLVAERVRQAIRLQVTALYMACLSQEASGKAIEASVEQAKTLMKEMEALYREGLVLKSSLEDTRTFLTSQQNRLAENQRLRKSSKAELMEAMGLSPLVDVTLKGVPSLDVKDEELTNQIYEALINRPEMRIADRNIAIKEDAVKIAIADFLPMIGLFSEYTTSSNSYQYYESILSYGIGGMLTIFDGFANIQDYRAAKQELSQATVEREQSCLKIMLEVIKARDLLKKAEEMKTLLSKEAEASSSSLREIQAQWDEGMVTSSDKLKAISRLTTAEANLALADYQYQVAAAAMMDVMGLSGKE